MFHNRIRSDRSLPGPMSRIILVVIFSLILATVLLSGSIAFGSENTTSSGDIGADQIFAALLADEEVLLEDFHVEDAQDGKVLRFSAADVNGDGKKDLIVSRDKPGDLQNGDTCFYAIKKGKPHLIGMLKPNSLQKVGYHTESGYLYLYTEEKNGGQKVELFSFPEDAYDVETGKNNCVPYMSFEVSPDKDGNPHYYVDEKELTEKKFSKAFIKNLGKPAPFYEDEYYFGWDGYELAAKQENTPEERIQAFGSDGSTTIQPETETEAAVEETEAPKPETESEETEAAAEETEAPEPEMESEETEAAVEETEAPKPETELEETEAAVEETEAPEPEAESEETEAAVKENGTWICPECGNEATGNFCGKCGAANPSPEWICPNCGETVTGNFCKNCGTARPGGQEIIETDNAPENQETPTEVSNTSSWENNLLMEEHGALGELKADGGVPEAKEYVFDNPNWKRSEVEGIYILNTKQNMPANAVDVSGGKEGTVMAWLDEYKHLYIAGEGGVRANENASALFAWFENVKEIHFDGNLHTDYCTNMSHMFYHCHNLKDINLDGINTEYVVNMTKMFTACSNLHKLDISQLRTGRVESFYATFQKCGSLDALDLTSFDTSMAKNMALMFADCTNLQSIILNTQSFKTDLVETMSYMFDGCEALYYVNLAGFNTHSVKRTNYMFRNCKSFEKIFLENHDFSSIEEHEGMFQGALMEGYYGTNGERLFMNA